MDKTNSLKKPFSPYFKNVEIEDGEDEMQAIIVTRKPIYKYISWQDQEE